MMQNSCIFILVFLLVETAIDRTNDLPAMIAGVPRCAEHSNLASIPAAVGAKQPSPMSLFSPSPAPGFRQVQHLGFGIGDCVLYLLLGMARPTGHFPNSDLVAL
jgi:hypothetical protein